MAKYWDITSITRFLERGVKALETIAANSKPKTTEFNQSIQTSEILTYNEVKEKVLATAPIADRVPAYFMPPGEKELVIDEDPSNGFGVVTDNEIVIRLPKQWWPDHTRAVVNDPDLVIKAITIGVNYDKKSR